MSDLETARNAVDLARRHVALMLKDPRYTVNPDIRPYIDALDMLTVAVDELVTRAEADA